MKKLLEISLGVVTSVGGFFEIGSMVTAAQAGAAFRFQLIWAIVLGTLCVVFLVEMAGRFAAVSRHAIVDGIREKFGFSAFLWPLLSTMLVSFAVMSAEIGGIAVAMELATGIGF